MNKVGKIIWSALILTVVFLSPPLLLGQESETTPPALPPSAPETSEGEKPGYVTMDFKEADINTVLRLLSLKSGMNIVAGPEVQGTVTVRLENVPWERALEVVLRTYGYVYERVDNVIRVTTSEKMSQEELITKTFILEYIQLAAKKPTASGQQQQTDAGAEIVEIIATMLSERGRVKMVAQRNALVVTDTPSNVYKISEVIKKLDQITPQAYVDTKVVKTQLDKGENLGIRWNIANVGVSSGAARPVMFPFATAKDTNKERFPGVLEDFFPVLSGTAATSGTTTTGTVTRNADETRAFPLPDPVVSNRTFTFGTLDFTSFSALLSMLESRSNTKVVSNPRIVVLNNQTAKVSVGEEFPIPTFERNETTGSFEVTGFSYKDLGVVLNVTPHINTAEEILVDLKPEVSSQGSTITYTASLSAFSFNVTKAETQVLIRSGETIAIGGLMEDKVAVSEQRVPYLGSIPLLGKLFRSKRQTEGSANRNIETLFFVTVTVIDTEGQPTGGTRGKEETPVLSKETVGSQSVVQSSQPPLTPAKTATG